MPMFNRMLYLIGLGLGDVTDITVKGLETVRKCDKVFLEAYTSLLLNSELDTLEKYYDKEITIADREMVESQSELILDPAESQDVAFLVVGDPLGATTHTDIILRAIERGISYRVIHNASIMNAVASTGLQLYNFGDTVSICLWKENWKPTSFVDKILKNLRNGLHVLCLLDIRVSSKFYQHISLNCIFELYIPNFDQFIYLFKRCLNKFLSPVNSEFDAHLLQAAKNYHALFL